jgi:hypothetical protein
MIISVLKKKKKRQTSTGPEGRVVRLTLFQIASPRSVVKLSFHDRTAEELVG